MSNNNNAYLDYDHVLAFLVNRASHALRRSLTQRFRDAGFALSPDDFMVLQRLADGAPISQRELVQRTYKDGPAISRALAGLIGHGYVEARPSAEDRRVRVLALTRAGRTAHRRLQALATKNLEHAERSIAARDLDTTRKVLGAIWENLEASL